VRESPPSSSDGKPALPVARCSEEQLNGQLEALLRVERNDAALRVENLRRLTGGASHQTWSFDVVHGDKARLGLILRRDPPGTGNPAGMAREAAALRAAAEAGVPEPALLLHSDDSRALGAPFLIMEKIDGETIARRILREPQYRHVRGTLAYQCGEILARIHSIGREHIQGLAEPDPLADCAAAATSSSHRTGSGPFSTGRSFTGATPPRTSGGCASRPGGSARREEAHSQRLAALGYDTDRDLVEAIRAGRYDADIAGLAAALEPDVRAKLEVADPRYLADCDPFR